MACAAVFSPISHQNTGVESAPLVAEDETALHAASFTDKSNRGQYRSGSSSEVFQTIQKFITPHKDSHTKFADVITAAKSKDYEEAGKRLFHLLVNDSTRVRGLGFSIRGVEQLISQDRDNILEQIRAEPQHSLHWEDKLKLAAIATAIQLAKQKTEQFVQEADREAVTKHFTKVLAPGDVMFFAQGGKAEPFGSELFQGMFRWRGAKRAVDEKVPFVHVGMYLGDGNVLHISSKGTKLHSLKRLLVDTTRFDAVAVGRLELAPDTLKSLIEEAQKFSVDKKYNLLWSMNLFGWSRRWRFTPVDRSATSTRAVCPDLLSEPARILREKGKQIPQELIDCSMPYDLFEANCVQLREAAAFKRDS